jgi:type VII secretion protein EccB
MQTRRDHVHAYQFAMARLGSALVSGEPGLGRSPTRRPQLATFFGILIVVLLCIAFAVYGLLVPGGKTSWRKPGSIIVEKETGNRYLYVDGKLRPARNYASALLLAGDNAEVRSVSRNSLAGVRHGTPVGIAGAPDALPPAKDLLTGSWTRCLRSDVRSGQVLDFDPADRIRDFPDDRQVLLSLGDDRYLLWRGTKYPIPDDTALIALGLDSQKPVPAPRSWLSTLPTGAKLTAARVPLRGKPGRKIAGRPTRVGQLFQINVADTTHYYVMRSDGVEPLNPTQAALLIGRPGTAPARSVGPADIAAVPVSRGDSLPPLPDVLGVPPLHLAEEVLCLEQKSRGEKLRSRVVLEHGPAVSGSARTVIPPGRGVFAVDQAQLSEENYSPQLYVITEQGVLYPLANDQSANVLGYGNAAPLPLPQAVLTVLPRGPWLGEASAVATVGGR